MLTNYTECIFMTYVVSRPLEILNILLTLALALALVLALAKKDKLMQL